LKVVLLRALSSRWAKLPVFGVALLPLAWLVWGAATQGLGANPAEALIRSTGDWTLRFLCVVLAITPVRVVFGLPSLARLRRMVGLFVYFYAVLHLAAYSWLDMGLDVGDITRDIGKRPFILVGFTCFVLLSALAATSFDRAVRALGGRRWRNLHRLVYLVVPLALLHFFWMRAGKNDFNEVIVYALVLSLLLGWRALKFFNKKGL
jgi:sulfoxide reductase heme-binding subunit YedZ